MRVKLSYTVEEEDILKEAAKILGLSQEDVGHCINMFKAVQEELRREDETPNTDKALDMIEDFRKALLAVDTRLIEVEDIVKGYSNYRVSQRSDDDPPALENERYYGAD
tara:strand:+ start:91 stop:417 length:327 start_codon:yes stop_codon:yes gene_type:complete